MHMKGRIRSQWYGADTGSKMLLTPLTSHKESFHKKNCDVFPSGSVLYRRRYKMIYYRFINNIAELDH
jgi:hypothetical protein